MVHLGKMITGTKKRYPVGSTVLSFGSGTHTVDDVTGAMQALITNRSNVEAAENATTVALEAERAAMPALLALIAAFTKFVRATFTSADALADFDLTPRKVPAPMTAEAKAIAAAKRAATRKARGTTSAKQKATVKGNVTAQLVVTPVTTAPAPAPAAPAPATGGTTPGGGTTPAHG
jgi:hypothetical protein